MQHGTNMKTNRYVIPLAAFLVLQVCLADKLLAGDLQDKATDAVGPVGVVASVCDTGTNL